MIDLKRRHLTLEQGIEAFTTESKDKLKEAARHKFFTPSNQRRRPAMHKRTKDNKGKRR